MHIANARLKTVAELPEGYACCEQRLYLIAHHSGKILAINTSRQPLRGTWECSGCGKEYEQTCLPLDRLTDGFTCVEADLIDIDEGALVPFS